MLRDFLSAHAVVRTCFEEAETALGRKLISVMLDGPEAELNRTEITQPVLLTASIALWRLWMSRVAEVPSVMAGHSLGEYSALVAAGAMDFAAAVRLVALRGQLMQAAVPAGEGAMAAILGLDEATVMRCCDAVDGVVSAANINAPGQIVIAGTTAAVDLAIESCSAQGAKRAMKLAVSVPSHCALMTPAAAQFEKAIAAVEISEPRIPVVQNVDAASTSDPERIRENLVAQLSQPVRWTACVERIVGFGATTLVECGPGKVLGGLIKRIDKAARVVSLSTPELFINAVAEVSGD